MRPSFYSSVTLTRTAFSLTRVGHDSVHEQLPRRVNTNQGYACPCRDTARMERVDTHDLGDKYTHQENGKLLASASDGLASASESMLAINSDYLC